MAGGAAESSHKYGLGPHHAAIAHVVFRVLLMVVVELYGAQQVPGGVGDVVGEDGFVVLAFLLGLGDEPLDESLPCLAAASHQCLWETFRKAQ
jgi:hypothetical protein